jgi:hypothetical protein
VNRQAAARGAAQVEAQRAAEIIRLEGELHPTLIAFHELKDKYDNQLVYYAEHVSKRISDLRTVASTSTIYGAPYNVRAEELLSGSTCDDPTFSRDALSVEGRRTRNLFICAIYLVNSPDNRQHHAKAAIVAISGRTLGGNQVTNYPMHLIIYYFWQASIARRIATLQDLPMVPALITDNNINTSFLAPIVAPSFVKAMFDTSTVNEKQRLRDFHAELQRMVDLGSRAIQLCRNIRSLQGDCTIRLVTSPPLVR